MVRIYGASDDLIEIDQDIYDEVNHYSERSKKIEFSDGTKASIKYDKNGEWKITVKEKGTKFLKLIPAVGDDNTHTEPEADGASSYSDVLLVDVTDWVKVGSKTYKS